MKYTVTLEYQNKRGILPTIFTSKKKAIELLEKWLEYLKPMKVKGISL